MRDDNSLSRIIGISLTLSLTCVEIMQPQDYFKAVESGDLSKNDEPEAELTSREAS